VVSFKGQVNLGSGNGETGYAKWGASDCEIASRKEHVRTFGVYNAGEMNSVHKAG
jgi:hypothetical protein